MATASDILFNDDNEYLFSNGDFVIGDSDQQHIKDIIFEGPGAYKQYPQVGVGIINYLNASGAQLLLKKNIKLQLEADGYRVEIIEFIGDSVYNFTIDAERN